MKSRKFNAFCPAEIGDIFNDKQGNTHTITDIAAVHYVKSGNVDFAFELNNSGKYVSIEFPAAVQKETSSKNSNATASQSGTK